MAYPDVCTRPAPTFLSEKYGDVKGLLTQLREWGVARGLPTLNSENLEATYPSFQTLFTATADEIEEHIGLAANASQAYRVRIQRLLLWEDLDAVVAGLGVRFDRVVAGLPRHLLDVEEAGGGRDLLDPFIFAFSSRLLHQGALPALLRTLVAHKCLMKLEDLIGHLHQEALGSAGGGQFVPEPGGSADETGRLNKEQWHETLNPYPGADARKDTAEFYQIKNKTGSAKGSDGEKLARQFLVLKEKYPDCERYYVSMIGRTLSGHRSMGAFLRTDPGAKVLVGLAAFQQLGRHRDTADIVMELYVEEFDAALHRNNYDFDHVVASMVDEWQKKHGTGNPAIRLLRDSITPVDPNDQSSATYIRRRN